MFVIVVGGGKTGSQLGVQLLAEGHQVRVIEAREIMLERLHAELPPEVIVAGDGSSPSVLESAGIRHANVLAAVTGEDDANLVVTSLGRFEFNVPRIIARVNNPSNAWLFTPEMGVDVAINQTDLMAKLIAEEMSLGDMMTLLKLRKGEYAVVEEKVAPLAPAAGKAIQGHRLARRVHPGGRDSQGDAHRAARRRRAAARGRGHRPGALLAGRRAGGPAQPGGSNEEFRLRPQGCPRLAARFVAAEKRDDRVIAHGRLRCYPLHFLASCRNRLEQWLRRGSYRRYGSLHQKDVGHRASQPFPKGWTTSDDRPTISCAYRTVGPAGRRRCS